MSTHVEKAGLTVARELVAFVEDEALPGLELSAAAFWQGLSNALAALAPAGRALLAEREQIQSRIDAWHRASRDQPFDAPAYEAFLREIGYIVPEGADFTVETTDTDAEIATIPGPQLVVPSTNARYALNAANARWGSLYDALYGTDALGSTPPPGTAIDEMRARKVIDWTRGFLDAAVPLVGSSWREARRLAVIDGRLSVRLDAGSSGLAQPDKLIGWRGDAAAPSAIILRNNGLHVELIIDGESEIGAMDDARIADVRIESALTTIVDCEDSVTAVDAADKVACYRTWLGLMKKDLTAEVTKAGRTFTRRLADDVAFTGRDGTPARLRGRSLLLVRTVGHLMTTPAVRDAAGEEAPEGIIDAFVTALCALHDRRGDAAARNSATGAIYMVKPKMHGPDEVAHAVKTLDLVEDTLDLDRNTIKLGIMDEERRTSVNLKECIRAARARIAFINTGFLDRTGDEIHTSMEAGPVLPRDKMKKARWLDAYERRNVAIGLVCGLMGRAQIGKGMWAAPDLMGAMLAEKGAQLEAGASCAWVPSPVAATLHATHYHRVDVVARQKALAAAEHPDLLGDLLAIPLADAAALDADTVRNDVENNAQGILGYVVRWIDQGIGCSKVPNIHDVALMEDRATCRISSQALANWLLHGVISEDEVVATLQKMAALVDEQNAADPAYAPMAPGFDGPAFRAAHDLVLKGREQPSGYTEKILHAWRAVKKKAQAA